MFYVMSKKTLYQMNAEDLSIKPISSLTTEDDSQCEMTCITGRPSRTKGAVLYIGDSKGRCHFFSHAKQNFYQNPIILFPYSKQPSTKRISQLCLVKYSQENFFLAATSGFRNRTLAMLNEFTSELKHFKFTEKIVKIGLIRDYKSNVRENPSPLEC